MISLTDAAMFSRNWKKTLGEYGELKLDPESVGKRAKRVWRIFTWEPEDIKELRNRINSNVTLRERSSRGERFKSEDATYNDKENKLELR